MKTWLIVIALTLFFACAILARFIPAHAVSLGTVGALSALFSIYTVIQRARNAKPYERTFSRADWIREEGELQQYFIRIPAGIHKKGKHPQVEFFDVQSPYSSTNLVYDTDADGSIVIRNHPNSTMFQFKEFKTKIR